MNRNYASIIIAVVAILAALLFVWPKYKKMGSLKGEIASEQTNLETQTDYYNEVKSVSDQLNSYSDALNKVYSAIPSDPELSATFNFLQTEASQSGLIMTNVKIVGSVGELVNSGKSTEKKVSNDPNLKSTTLGITLEGSYSSLETFLSAIETSSRLIEVQEIAFKKPPKTGDPFDFNVTAVIYSY